MTLLDRFRRSVPWEDPDPSARAEAVRKIEDQALLARIAASDQDARVRRATVRRLNVPAAVAPLLKDVDGDVREEAAEALLALAMSKDPALAGAAVAVIDDVRRLSRVVRTAPVAAVRETALSRIGDARTLATVAKTAEVPAMRLEALRRLDEAALVLEVAIKSEHKDVAAAAVERLTEPDALRAVASQARNRAASRRAEARLEAMLSTSDPMPHGEPEESPVEAWAAQANPSPVAPAYGMQVPVESMAQADDVAPLDEEPAPVAVAPPEESVAQVDEASPPMEETRQEQAADDVDHEPAESPAAHEPMPPEEPHAKEKRAARVARVEALCAKLEEMRALPGLTLRDAEAALRDSKSEPDDAAVVPGKLAQRLKAARSSLFFRIQELREADEWSRWGNAAVQEELCRRLEALVAREDHERVAAELRQADVRWAEVRFAPKDQARALRDRYQAARAQIKARLDDYYAKREEEGSKNLEQREALCVRAEALADSTDWLKASEELKALQATWKSIGPTPRRQGQKLWKRFHAACDRFFTRRHDDLRQRKSEWAANLQGKESLCQQAEALAGSTDWEAAAAEVRRLQGEWRRIGPVRRRKSEEIWGRFRRACDAFFDRYKRRDALEVEARLAERERLCGELEGLLTVEEGAQPPEGLADKVLSLQAQARQQSQLPVERESALASRFAAARDRLIEAFPESFRGTELDPQANRSRKEKRCERLEAMLPSGEAEDPAQLSGAALARRLKEALASNTIAGRADVATRQRADALEVEAAQAAWKRLGPVPGKLGAELEERFRTACNRLAER